MTHKEALQTLKEIQTNDRINVKELTAILTAIKFMETNKPAPYICHSVRSLIEAMRDGGFEPEMGETVLQLDDERSRWKIVDARMTEDGKHKITLMVTNIIDYAPFARPDKEHPWGWNNYDASQIKEELLEHWLPILFGDESDLLHQRADVDRLFLLSTEEVGFEQTDNTLKYFQGKDEDELDERRQMQDTDGDDCHWWLRSPYPGNASIARSVDISGALYGYNAPSGTGAAPACEIIF